MSRSKTTKSGKKKSEQKAKLPETEAKKLKKLIKKLKKKKPVFRGRFGKKQIRRKSKEKWDKWRRPRGLDIRFYKEDGAVVDIGYRNPKKIRGLHPSGFEEVVIHNEKEMLGLDPKKHAIKIGRTIGKRKKEVLVSKATAKGFKVLNP
ncbi:MAG: 50S ribosomal protein L32e [Candidatus Diapherotrites archaeon]|nr:50S ribosomal protein L32e [Candidatus Diapherotrites archaeon]